MQQKLKRNKRKKDNQNIIFVGKISQFLVIFLNKFLDKSLEIFASETPIQKYHAKGNTFIQNFETQVEKKRKLKM